MQRRTVLRWAMTCVVAGVVAVGVAGAQGRSARASIPPGQLPPAGACRVWYDGRPAGQQPSPTRCDVARREAAQRGGRVIYGDGAKRGTRNGQNGRDDPDYSARDGRRDRHRVDQDEDDDRDDDNRDSDRRDRDDRACAHRDRDGRCDDAYGTGRRDPDGRNPDGRRYPTTLPETVWGVIFDRGDRLAVDGVRQWLGGGELRPQYTDSNGDGRAEKVTWYNGTGTILQQWFDDNGDGRADRVTLYKDGKGVRVIR